MDRRYWLVVLALVAVGAIIFAIVQNQSLNQTQTNLLAAQVTVTAQSNALIEQSTAASGTQVAMATSAVDAQSTAAAAFQSAAATAVSAAQNKARDDAATAQSTAATAQAQAVQDAQNAAATEQAAALDDAQATAVAAQNEAVGRAYDEAATPYVATQTKLQDDLATSQAAAQGNQSQLADALATQSALQEALASAEAQLSAAQVGAATPTLPPDIAAIPVPPGWERIIGKGVALQLPESFDSFDLVGQDTKSIADLLRALGPDFEAAANLIEQNPDIFRFFAYDNRSKQGQISNVLVLQQDLTFNLPLKSLVDATVAQFPAGIDVIENDIVQVGTYQAGRIVTDTHLTAVEAKQIEYFFIENGKIWIVVYTTSANEFPDRLPVFEQSIQSIEFLPTS